MVGTILQKQTEVVQENLEHDAKEQYSGAILSVIKQLNSVKDQKNLINKTRVRFIDGGIPIFLKYILEYEKSTNALIPIPEGSNSLYQGYCNFTQNCRLMEEGKVKFGRELNKFLQTFSPHQVACTG